MQRAFAEGFGALTIAQTGRGGGNEARPALAIGEDALEEACERGAAIGRSRDIAGQHAEAGALTRPLAVDVEKAINGARRAARSRPAGGGDQHEVARPACIKGRETGGQKGAAAGDKIGGKLVAPQGRFTRAGASQRAACASCQEIAVATICGPHRSEGEFIVGVEKARAADGAPGRGSFAQGEGEETAAIGRRHLKFLAISSDANARACENLRKGEIHPAARGQTRHRAAAERGAAGDAVDRVRLGGRRWRIGGRRVWVRRCWRVGRRRRTRRLWRQGCVRALDLLLRAGEQELFILPRTRAFGLLANRRLRRRGHGVFRRRIAHDAAAFDHIRVFRPPPYASLAAPDQGAGNLSHIFAAGDAKIADPAIEPGQRLAIAAGDRHLAVFPRHSGVFAGDMHRAGGAVFLHRDDRHAAANADGRGRGLDHRVGILGDAPADEPKHALGHRHVDDAVAGVGVKDVAVQNDGAVSRNGQAGLVAKQQLARPERRAFDQFFLNHRIAERQRAPLFGGRGAVHIPVHRRHGADIVRRHGEPGRACQKRRQSDPA